MISSDVTDMAGKSCILYSVFSLYCASLLLAICPSNQRSHHTAMAVVKWPRWDERLTDSWFDWSYGGAHVSSANSKGQMAILILAWDYLGSRVACKLAWCQGEDFIYCSLASVCHMSYQQLPLFDTQSLGQSMARRMRVHGVSMIKSLFFCKWIKSCNWSDQGKSC